MTASSTGLPTETSGGVSPKPPISERVCDQVSVSFALWTLCCHAVVFAPGTLETLLALFAFACGVWIVWLVKNRGRSEPSHFDSPQAKSGSLRGLRADWTLRVAGLVLGLAGTLVYYRTGNTVILWWWILILLGGAAVWAFYTGSPRISSPIRKRSWEMALWTLALGCVVLTLVCHRPDADDAFYINIAVATADTRGWELLGSDALHGIEGLPLHRQIYRVHSYELLNGALSYLTGIPAIYCFHWISAAIAALLVPLAHARLFRLLTPKRWLIAVAVLVFLLVAVGETHRWYGNFSFVRMWQGKSIFLFVFTPLIYAYALRFALRPTRRGWLLLTAAQIAAVGTSSSAIWAAPAGALMALICATRPTREGLRTLFLGATTSAYALGIGWLMKSESQITSAPISDTLSTLTQDPLAIVLGNSRLLLLCVFAILVTWASCRPGLARRFALFLPLAVSAVLLNPYAAQWVRANITGPSYWRGLWALPLPILLALLLLMPLELGRRRGWPALGWTAGIFVWVAFASLVPDYSGISYKNAGARLGPPALKVPSVAYDVAARLNRSVSAGSYVVAPPEINTWLPTFHDHAYPLKVRGYLDHQTSVSAPDRRLRTKMIRYAAQPTRSASHIESFLEGLDRYHVEAVCLRRGDRRIEALGNALRRAGFREVNGQDGYEIWISGEPGRSSRM